MLLESLDHHQCKIIKRQEYQQDYKQPCPGVHRTDDAAH